MIRSLISSLLGLIVPLLFSQPANARQMASYERMAEFDIKLSKTYSDPFNDVDLDVIFSRGDLTWRVPAFWRGGNRWTVRFAPPAPGTYTYRLEGDNLGIADKEANEGAVSIKQYRGPNPLLRQGPLKVSENKRYFEHSDGTPFFWLGDWLVAGLSDRMDWNAFKTYVDDRKEKGFTVVQIGVMTCSNEETAPVDAGFRNEGGAVWDPEFKSINPKYFDYADRRIEYLIDAGITPAIWGAWRQALGQMGQAAMKKHWRYIIARYGAYPVFWLVGGEVYDPPADMGEKFPGIALNEGQAFLDGRRKFYDLMQPGWTDIVRFVRQTDPYRHPTTVHEINQPFDAPLQDESLTDFDMFQMGHIGWPAIGVEVAQLNMHYARQRVTKPLVVGEIGFENFGQSQFADFQRAAFWLAMLNGAAGHSYGADNLPMAGTSPTRDLPRGLYSFATWREGLNLPGSYQLGLGAKLLRDLPWWKMTPHPEWVTPRGTTLLEPRSANGGYDLGDWSRSVVSSEALTEENYPGGEWRARKGTFRLPYAAGVPGTFRMIYIPYFGFMSLTYPPPTILALEEGVAYDSYYWQPSTGVKIDLGVVRRPAPGALLDQQSFEAGDQTAVTETGSAWVSAGRLKSKGGTTVPMYEAAQPNIVAAVDVDAKHDATLMLRYRNADNFVAARYDPAKAALYIFERKDGKTSPELASVTLPAATGVIRLTAEVRDNNMAASAMVAGRAHTTPIIAIGNNNSGTVGLSHSGTDGSQSFDNFEVRLAPKLCDRTTLPASIYDAQGNHRAELAPPRWHEYRKDKAILLDAYRPERTPTPGDWLLVLKASGSQCPS